VKNKNLLCPLCPSKFSRPQNRMVHIVTFSQKVFSEKKALPFSKIKCYSIAKRAVGGYDAMGYQ